MIAFQNYSPFKGILGSEWVELKWFKEFFESPFFFRTIKNTLLLNFYNLLFGFPAPIILALIINGLRRLYRQ